MRKIGFDSEKYLELQEKEILSRASKNNQKLYLEIGGKLFDDLHASRVLPGFEPDIKIKFLQKLKDKLEIICCINAKHISSNKMRADYGITYDIESIRMIDNFRAMGLKVSSVVITLFNGESSVIKFAKLLESRGERVYFHHYTKGYPNDIETIVSEEGYGANPYIETTSPLVVVTAPGPSSGKLATCLSQLYHEYKRGVSAGYAKFETFPVWNLSLNHPLNKAYESATADLKDVNMIDMFHLQEYGKVSVNYNRDLEVFPVLKNILKKITGQEVYKSPTDMCVNMVGFAITDDQVVREASKQEIVRRYYRTKEQLRKGQIDQDTLTRIEMLMSEVDVTKNYRTCAVKAVEKTVEKGRGVIALEAENFIAYGTTDKLVSRCSSVVLNALKMFAGIDDDVKLISSEILTPILKLRKDFLGERKATLPLNDVLSALAICAKTDKLAKRAYDMIPRLKNANAHATYNVSSAEQITMVKLGVFITQEIINPSQY